MMSFAEKMKQQSKSALIQELLKLGIYDEVAKHQRFDDATTIHSIFSRSYHPRFEEPLWGIFYSIFMANPSWYLAELTSSENPDTFPFSDDDESATAWEKI